MATKLSIGCRNRPVGPEWVAVDLFVPQWAEKFPDRFVQANALRLPFEDASFDYILVSHVFEHFPRFNEIRVQAMREWWRVLKVGGEIKIIVPNMARYCALYLEGKWTMETFSNMTYGMQTNLEGEVHYAGYDANSLIRLWQKHLGKNNCKLVLQNFGRRGRFPIDDLEIRTVFHKEG